MGRFLNHPSLRRFSEWTQTLKLKAEQLAGDIAAQAQTLDDLNGLIRTLMKSALERMLDTELDVHLGRKAIAALPPPRRLPGLPAAPNRRNGHSRKTVRGELGQLTRDTPRDRNGTSGPQSIANTSAASPASTRRSSPSTPRA